MRRPERPPRAQRRDARAGQRVGLRPTEARLVFHQHRARRSRRQRGARSGRFASAASASGSTCLPASRRTPPARSPIRSCRCRTSTARITSARRPIRRRRRSRPRPSASSQSYKDTGKVPNVVNLAKKTPATHMLVVRHRDRPGVLAHVFEHLRGGAINVQETENMIFEGAQAAVARINLDGAPPRRAAAAMQDGQHRHPRSSSGDDMSRPVHRVYNFSAGPAVLPLPVLEEIQRDLHGAARRRHVDPRDQPSLEGVRGDPRAGRGRHPRAGRHSVELQGAVPAGRRQPAVLDGADEPADGRRDRRLHRHRLVGREGDQGSEEGRHGQRRRVDQGAKLLAACRRSPS